MKTDMKVGEKQVQLGLDRIVIGFPAPKPFKPDEQNPPTQELIAQFNAQKKQYVSHMKHIEAMIKQGKYFIQKQKGNGKAKLNLQRYNVLSEEGKELLCVFTLGFVFGKATINFEVNPSRMTTSMWGELLDLLSVMFDGHYLELYSRGVVSHAEFFVDVTGENLSDLVLVDTGRRTTTIFNDTTYHGGRYSRLVGTMYDKAKELGIAGQLVRFEVRINRRDIPFRDLVELPPPNPLSNFLVVGVNRLQSVANEWEYPQLANHIRELGLYGAVKNKHAREAILGRLKQETVAWWQPDILWAAHRELLLNFQPGYVGGITQA